MFFRRPQLKKKHGENCYAPVRFRAALPLKSELGTTHDVVLQLRSRDCLGPAQDIGELSYPMAGYKQVMS